MNNKGFTLIELIAVVTILSLLVLLVSTAVTKILKNSKSDLSDMQISLIISAAEAWTADNLDKIPRNGNCRYLLLSDLKEYGLLDSKIVDAINDNEIPDSLKIKISSEYKNYNLTFEVGTDVNGCGQGYQYLDDSGASVPDLMNNSLIPVKYDILKNSWVIVDPEEEWYNYDEQEWANAVILSEKGKSKSVGEALTIPLSSADDAINSDIVAMFVWIPRYSYTILEDKSGNANGVTLDSGSLPSVETPGAIDIKFINPNTTDTGIATYTGEIPNGWYTHPAFTFGDKELSGIWVGKFETSHITLSKTTTANGLSCKLSKENCQSADGLRILPNQMSLRYNNISNYFYAAQSMSREGNPFGLDFLTTDSHMMKNSEWGAVAYLSQSKYGKYGNSDYEGVEKEIYKNDSSNQYTGRSSGKAQTNDSSEEGTYYYYEEKNGTGASTTGNIYGIYDMNGGSYEYVMGVLGDSSNNPRSGYTSSSNSGFNGSLETDVYNSGIDFPNTKYYDLYLENVELKDKNYNGHALGETKGWYLDTSEFVSAKYPWLYRGGSYYNGSFAGIFYFNYSNGGAGSNSSFRIVLSLN